MTHLSTTLPKRAIRTSCRASYHARASAQAREYLAIMENVHVLAQAQHDFIVGQSDLRIIDPDRALSMPRYVDALAAMIAERDVLDCQLARRGNALRAAGIEPALYVGRNDAADREDKGC